MLLRKDIYLNLDPLVFYPEFENLSPIFLLLFLEDWEGNLVTWRWMK